MARSQPLSPESNPHPDRLGGQMADPIIQLEDLVKTYDTGEV